MDDEDVWEEREAEGVQVEKWAEHLFDGAVRVIDPLEDDDAEERRSGIAANIETTRNLLRSKRPVLQAHLGTDELLAIIDILEPRDDGWFLWEVKASTSLKPLFHVDLAFQVHVAKACGIKIVGAGVIHLNKEYVRADAIDSAALLVEADCSADIDILSTDVAQTIDAFIALLKADSIPHAQPSGRCKGSRGIATADRPSTCGHLGSVGYCGRRLPKNWIGQLPDQRGKTATYLQNRTDLTIRELDLQSTEVVWTSVQRRMIEAVQQNSPQIDNAALAQKLGELVWPVTYMDFEFDPGMAVPRFRNSKPYEKVPFQWSIQIQRSAGGDLEPLSFLYSGSDDPRARFAESLVQAVPDTGSIVVHSRGAEMSVLNRLAEVVDAPTSTLLMGFVERLYDTVDLARAGYYHPNQHGSYSIKKLAPALLGSGYEDLEIQNGMAAVVAWKQLIDPDTSEADRNLIKDRLLRYCGRDTELMHRIVEAFRKLN